MHTHSSLDTQHVTREDLYRRIRTLRQQERMAGNVDTRDLTHDPLNARRYVEHLDLPQYAKLLLSQLADHVPNVHPSRDEMHRRTGMSNTTISKYTRWLEEQGLISTQRPLGRGRRIIYTLTCLTDASAGRRLRSAHNGKDTTQEMRRSDGSCGRVGSGGDAGDGVSFSGRP